MPHQRSRFLEPTLLSSLRWSPAVGVFGLRQVGKTTLAQNVVSKLRGAYETFDREASLQASREAPVQFCSREALLCIDEAQKGPWIFPAIKDCIGTERRPARFLLTGSIRFTMKKEIRESLTGRIVLRELLPFNIAEAKGLPPSRFLEKLLSLTSRKVFESLAGRISVEDVRRHIMTGGMPVACFTRNSARRREWFQGYYETLLTRDLALIDQKLSQVSLRQGFSLLRFLALKRGQEVSFSELASQGAIRMTLAQRFLLALELLGLVERIPPEVLSRKSVRKMQIEWKDVGLWGFALGLSSCPQEPDDAVLSPLLTQEFMVQLSQMEGPVHWSFYKSRDGARIPWIFRRGKSSLALLTLPVESPSPYDYRVLKGFLSKEKQGLGIILGPRTTRVQALAPNLWMLPYLSVF